MAKTKTKKRVRFDLPPMRRKMPCMRASPGGTKTLFEDNVSLIIAVFLLFFIGAITVSWPYIADHIPRNVTSTENYSGFGGVGTRLKGNMAPQEYQKGNSTGTPFGDRFVDPKSMPKVLDADAQVYDPTDLNKKASSALSAGAARVLADMSKSTAGIQTQPMADPSQQEGKVMNDVKYATKGDGAVRQVDVDGKPISKRLVQLAMFENQDFMFRHENRELPALPHLQDPSNGLQKSHFGPMTYPLVWSKGTLGMDVMGNSNDTRATISFTGGRPPVFTT